MRETFTYDKVLFIISGAILHINEVLQQINEGIKVTNIETYISMSEQIISEIRERNFTQHNSTVEAEIDDAEARKIIIVNPF